MKHGKLLYLSLGVHLFYLDKIVTYWNCSFNTNLFFDTDLFFNIELFSIQNCFFGTKLFFDTDLFLYGQFYQGSRHKKVPEYFYPETFSCYVIKSFERYRFFAVYRFPICSRTSSFSHRPCHRPPAFRRPEPPSGNCHWPGQTVSKDLWPRC